MGAGGNLCGAMGLLLAIGRMRDVGPLGWVAWERRARWVVGKY